MAVMKSLCLLCIVSILSVFSPDRVLGEIIENKGTHFVVAFQSQYRNSFSGSNRIFISTDVEAKVRVQVPSLKVSNGTFDRNLTVARGLITVTLPGGLRMDTSKPKAHKGVRITSDKPVVVHGMNVYGNSSDAFLAIPVQVTKPNSEYIVSTYDPTVYALVLVVAAEANTKVTFTIRSKGSVPHNSKSYKTGDSFTVALDALECFQLQSFGDLTGTRVTSSKPISVFSGNDCASVPTTNVLCDHLVEQIPPVDLWGTRYFTTPTINSNAKDIYYIVASKNGSAVTINSAIKQIINAGEKYVYKPTSGSTDVISSKNPIFVVKYAKTQELDKTRFDPFMTAIPAETQFATEYLTFVPGEEDKTFVGFVNLVIKTEYKDGVRISGLKSHQSFNWAQFRGMPYSWCSVKLPAESSTGAVYYIYHTSPVVKFGAFMYGTVKTVDYHETYGFLGGFRVDRLNLPCIKPPMNPADGLDNDCDNRIDEEIFNGIDDDGDGSIDEDLATEKPTFSLPGDSSYRGCVNNVTSQRHDMLKDYTNSKCAYRGALSYSIYLLTVRAQCKIRIARKWSVRDACGNVVNKTQHIKITYPLPVVEYPPNVRLTCRSSKDLTPEKTGRVRVSHNICSVRITVDFSDSQTNSCHEGGSTLFRTWRVKEGCGRFSSHVQTIELLPGAKPSISYHRPNLELAIGKNITLPCVAKGSPRPEYSWVLPNGTAINVSTPVYVYEIVAADDDLTVSRRVKKVLPDGSLLISKARVDDSGKYTCIVKNFIGEDRSSTILTVRKDIVQVDVIVKLKEEVFDADLNNRSSLRYKTLETEVKRELTHIFRNITGFQRVEILKFINGSVDVLFRVVVKVEDPKSKPPQVVAKKVGETLNVKMKSGYLGKIKVSPLIKLREKPPAPKNVTIGDITHNQVNVFWTPPNLHQMYQVKDYSLQFKEFGSPKWHTYVKTKVLSYRLASLKSGTGYAVRLKAHNKYGVSDASDPVELTTLKHKTAGDWVVLVVVPILCVLLVAVLVYMLYRKWQKRNRRKKYGGAVRMNEILHQQNEEQEQHDCASLGTASFRRGHLNDTGSLCRYSTPPGNMSTTQMMLAARASDTPTLWREIPRNEIRLGRILGEGEYGMVLRGELKENGNIMNVAVKKLKRTATESDFKDLLNELELLCNVGSHPNIINLIGACTLHGPLMVVVEYAEHGNLLNYLRENRKQNYENMNECQLLLSVADRLKIAGEVARGMSHLAVMKCVHRDLAARNVLLDDKFVAKVSDFGLSRDVYTNSVYQKTTAGKLPAKWMAIEAIESGMYSSHSDVWSFGVLLWEIETGGKRHEPGKNRRERLREQISENLRCIRGFSPAKEFLQTSPRFSTGYEANTPYPGLGVPELLKDLKIGIRLDKPPNCDDKLYQMMRRCWCPDPKARPSFDELCTELKSMYSQATDYLVPSDVNILPSYQNVSLS